VTIDRRRFTIAASRMKHMRQSGKGAQRVRMIGSEPPDTCRRYPAQQPFGFRVAVLTFHSNCLVAETGNRIGMVGSDDRTTPVIHLLAKFFRFGMTPLRVDGARKVVQRRQGWRTVRALDALPLGVEHAQQRSASWNRPCCKMAALRLSSALSV